MRSHRYSPWFLFLVAGIAVAQTSGSSGDQDYGDRMAVEHAGDRPVAAAAAGGAGREVTEEEVSYAKIDGEAIVGFLARPADGAAGAPGILVIQEWWGLNDNMRAMARKLAAQGYVALAVDLYGGEVAEDPAAARELMSKAMGRTAWLEDNLAQAHGYLTSKGGADRVGVIGWCFGGGWSLNTALALTGEIDAAVIYYGRLVTDPERLAALQAPLLGIFGSADRGIPVDTVREFESALKELGKDARVHIYDGANHAFANPSGTRYDQAAAEDAWEKTLTFFDANLR